MRIRHVPKGFTYNSLIVTPRVLRLLLSPFIDEEKQRRKRLRTCPKPHSQEEAELGFEAQQSSKGPTLDHLILLTSLNELTPLLRSKGKVMWNKA